ncbi:MAG: formate/nitrite transporter family protein [Spirochaetales bacterium]|nr:formate/nitrite transporter family protein [Spirochaetales bacterium]
MAEGKMLIIDDEDIILESCRKLFCSEGYSVVTTNNPGEGLTLVKDVFFDVILCDWKMPGFDGMDIVEEIDKHSPDSAIIMISGYPTTSRATEAMKRGAMDYIAKPFTPEEIIAAVKQATRRKVTVEKKAIGRFEKIIKNMSFPQPNLDDKVPQTIAQTLAQTVGVKKTTSSWFSVVILGILAGAYIGFGGLLSMTVSFDLAKYTGIGFSRFMAGSVFSVGLMLVVIAGAELFTGNNLMLTSTLTKDITIGKMLSRWLVVYITNFIGSIFLAFIFFFSGLWKMGNSALGQTAVNIAYNKVALNFGEALVRGIGCNWLVCLAVWMAMASRQTIGKIFAIFFPIMAFVAIGFEHSVANMFFIPSGIFLHDWAQIPLPAREIPLDWVTIFTKNLIPVTIGNIIGGSFFVAMSYWSVYLVPSGKKKDPHSSG